MSGGGRDGDTPLDDAGTTGLSIFEIATARWLHVEEIISLLTPESTLLSLSTSPPTEPPPSGTLLLYDRSVTRKYKADGHEWIKKRNSPKVREDHVKLRYHGAYRVAGSYVHSATTATIHRRAYRLLQSEGAPPGPTQNWVLLHYLDTMEAAQVSALFADHLAAAASSRRGAAGATPPPPVHRLGSSGDDGAVGSQQQQPQQQEEEEEQQPQPQRGRVYRDQRPPLPPRPPVGVESAVGVANQWPEYAKHVAAAASRVSDRGVPPQKRIPDPTPAIKAGLKPTAAGTAAATAASFPPMPQQQFPQRQPAHHHQRDSSLGDATMDVLWNMVMEEQTDDVDDELQEAAASAIQQHINPIIEAELVNTVEDAIQDVATTALEEHVNFVSDEDILQAVEQVMTEGQMAPDIEDKVVATLEDSLPAQLKAQLVETMEKELRSEAEAAFQAGAGNGRKKESVFARGSEEMSDESESEWEPQRMKAAPAKPDSPLPAEKLPQTPLPEVIDFTPAESCMNSDRPMHLVISTSASIPILPPDDLPYRWHLLAAFIDMSSSAEFSDPNKALAVSVETDPSIMKVALAPLRKLTPFSYKCEAPNDISYAGSRSIIIVGVRYVESPEPVWDAIRLAVKVCIQAEWQVASDLTTSKGTVFDKLVRPTFYAPAGGGNVQLLSQLSPELFSFYYDKNLPAHRVTVDNAPPLQENAAGNSSGSGDTHGRAQQSVSSTKESTEALSMPAPAPAMAAVASALKSLPYNPPSQALAVGTALSRKRTLSVDGSSAELTSANEVAKEWMAKQDPNVNKDKTLGETVDRHCKIRFVERLANAVAATEEDDKKQHQQQMHEPVSTDDEYEEYEDEEKILLDASQLKDIDDEALDSLLDSVLIRFVESLVDSCASEEEIKAEINTTGYAGFALLHYAALYNMKSLVPLLLSRGADPNLKTEKGDLTALHLASGAGNDQVVDLLCRNGSTIDAKDSFRLTPADHAVRNGYPEIAKWLREKKTPPQDKQPSKRIAPSQEDLTNAASPSRADELLQDAFRGLPLRDKLGLNLFVQKYRRQAKKKKDDEAAGEEEEKDSDSMEDSSEEEEEVSQRMEYPSGSGSRSDPGDNYRCGEPQKQSVASAGGSRSSSAVSSAVSNEEDAFKFISEQDRESLKVAMSMMSKEEVQELERAAPYSDVRNWMLRTNYESLREASIQLEKQAKRKNLTKGVPEGSVGTTSSASSATETSKGHGQVPPNAKLSQALAMLVLRKNLMGAGGAKGTQTHHQLTSQNQTS